MCLIPIDTDRGPKPARGYPTGTAHSPALCRTRPAFPGATQPSGKRLFHALIARMFVVQSACPIYTRPVTKMALQTATRRIITLITCLTLVIGSLSFVFGGAQHTAHAASAVTQQSAAPAETHTGHTAHHAAETRAASEHCPSDRVQESACHFAGCCPAELQPAYLLAPNSVARSASLRPVATSSVKLQAASLPERPPRSL